MHTELCAFLFCFSMFNVYFDTYTFIMLSESEVRYIYSNVQHGHLSPELTSISHIAGMSMGPH